jgi:hypothetical protein
LKVLEKKGRAAGRDHERDSKDQSSSHCIPLQCQKPVDDPPVLLDDVPGRPKPVAPPMVVPGAGRPMLGAGTPIIGLTPALLSSVAPSGMLPAVEPGDDGDSAVPTAVEPTDPVAQLPDVMPADPVALIPPPSKAAPAPDADIPVEPLAMPEEEEPRLQVGDTAGLSPPGSISVAPRPMPALDPVMPVEPVGPLIPVAPVAPGIPSGDTARSAGAAGAVEMVCAAAAPQLNSSTIIAVDNRRIETSHPPLRSRHLARSFSYMDKHCKPVVPLN